MGRIEGGIRLPMTELESRHHATILDALQRAKVLA
jgi:hypothetical protein